MKTFLFWTDGGDRANIEAETLEEAAGIASRKIKMAEWEDGAWGIVKDLRTEEQMDVPTAEQAADDEAGITDTERRPWSYDS